MGCGLGVAQGGGLAVGAGVMLTFGSLFAGIGGFDLGLEWAGMRCLWQVEIDDYCNGVLAKHWPDVRRYHDVRECGADNLAAVDLVCGGFPCQPHSVAGKRRGAADDRDLWPEMRRIVDELKPTYVMAENVPGIRTTILPAVLADLEGLGYEVACLVVPACGLGAPHRRERVFIVAHTNERTDVGGIAQSGKWAMAQGNGRADVANAIGGGCAEGGERGCLEGVRGRWQDDAMQAPQSGADVADAEGQSERAGLCASGPRWQRGRRSGNGSGAHVADAAGTGLEGQVATWRDSGQQGLSAERSWWAVEPDVRGMADGLPQGLDGGIDGSNRVDTVGGAAEVSEDIVRGVWECIAARPTSQGYGQNEQLTRELGDALSSLPHEVALVGGKGGMEKASRILYRMRQACEAIGLVRDASDSLAKAWKSLSGEEAEAVWLASMGRVDWCMGEWLGVPRVSQGVAARVERLRALGNAVVPQVVEWIGRQIVEADSRI